MSRDVVGLYLARHQVVAVVPQGSREPWVARADIDDWTGLADVLASLGEQRRVAWRTAHVALAWDVGECKLADDVPGFGLRELRRHVALEPYRYFTQGHRPVSTDVARLSTGWCCLAAIDAADLAAVFAGLERAGFCRIIVAPAMAWWAQPAVSYPAAPDAAFAPALMAALSRRPVVSLCPAEWQVRRELRNRQSTLWWLAAALVLWLATTGVQQARVSRYARAAQEELDRRQQERTALLAARASADSLSDAINFLRQVLQPTDQLSRLTQLALALPDSAFVSRFSSDAAGPVAAEVLARQPAALLGALEARTLWAKPSVDGAIVRERINDVEWHRFSIAADRAP